MVHGVLCGKVDAREFVYSADDSHYDRFFPGTGVLTRHDSLLTRARCRSTISAAGDGLIHDWGYTYEGMWRRRVQCFLDLYDRLVDQPGRNYSFMTVNENIADISGLQLSAAALWNDTCFKPTEPAPNDARFTQAQWFFIARCRNYCTKSASIDKYVTRVHPRNDHRCNVAMARVPKFREAFHCSQVPYCTIFA